MQSGLTKDSPDMDFRPRTMQTYIRLFLYSVLLSTATAGLLAQTVATSTIPFPVQREWLAIHPRIGGMYNWHTASFNGLEGVVDCGLFHNGTGFALGGSLTLETPILSGLHFGLGLNYVNRKGTLEGTSLVEPARNSFTDSVVDVTSANTLTTNLPYFEVQPELRLALFDIGKATLRAMGGFRAAFALSPTFSQERKIVTPDYAVYLSNGQQTLDMSNGDQPITTITKPVYGVSFGIENLLPVGKSSFFTQQVVFDYNFGNVAKDVNWSVYSVHADLGFRFSLQRSPEQPKPVEPPPVKIDTIKPPPPPVITKKEEAVKPLPILNVHINDVKAKLQTGNELRASLPLVNAVFFEQNSADIPSRYVNEAEQNIETQDAVEYHSSILRVVTKIIQQNPKASIVLEGATSGNDEKEGVALARRRADNVKEALQNLGIDGSRITVRSSVLPRITSNQEYAGGREENRRVDIVVNDAPLQEYVARQKFVQIQGSMKVDVEAQYFEAGEIRVMSNILPEYDVKKSDSRTLEFSQRLPKDNGDYKIEVNTSAPPFLTAHDEALLDLATLKREQIELNLSSFEAILRFDYNSSELSQANKDLLKQLCDILPAGATIEILGSADILGAEQKNKELSERRAKATENYIRSVSGAKFTCTSGISTDKFDDTKSEGRFLNRCIRIKVRN